MSTSKTIQVIGVPMDHGAGRRGVGMGPAAIRIAGLHKRLRGLDYEVRDLGDLEVPIPETLPEVDANDSIPSIGSSLSTTRSTI